MSKALGHNEITTEMIKFMIEDGKQQLFSIFNQAKLDRVEPRDWQVGITCKNYRDLPLERTARKLYARILEKEIKRAARPNNGRNTKCV